MSDADVMSPVPAAVAPPLADPVRSPAPGRALAARALLAVGCSQGRTGTLFEVHARTVRRMVAADVTDTRDDAGAVEHARTCLEETARRGSTAKERAAAIAWLERDAPVAEAPIGRHPHRAPARRSVTGHYLKRPATQKAATRSPRANHVGADDMIQPEPTLPAPSLTTAGLAPEQLADVARRQQRILHCSALTEYVLAAEPQGGQLFTLREALRALQADIMEAARTSSTILEQAGGGRSALHR